MRTVVHYGSSVNVFLLLACRFYLRPRVALPSQQSTARSPHAVAQGRPEEAMRNRARTWAPGGGR